MASIERTAYPRFRRFVTARELASLRPAEDEVAWARARARSDEHLLALVLALRCFQRLGYFPRPVEGPGDGCGAHPSWSSAAGRNGGVLRR
jgi:Domain of unknown function (DUF4158)